MRNVSIISRRLSLNLTRRNTFTVKIDITKSMKVETARMHESVTLKIFTIINLISNTNL